MAVRIVLPVIHQIEGRPFAVEFPESEGEYFVQLKRALSEESEASEERWVLNGLGSEFTAEAVAAIKPDGSAVTGQWRLGDKDFTWVIVERANDFRGFFVGQYAEEFNIPRMPSNLKDHEVSMDRSWATYIQYQDVPGSFQFGPCYIEYQCVSSQWSLYRLETAVHASPTGKMHYD